jgi:hypothetical protein
MIVYRTRPGIILTEICGEYVLIAARALLDQCHYLTQVNESSAFLWKQLEKGATLDDLMLAVKEEYETDDDTEGLISDFIRHMLDMNYLLVSEEG